MTESNKSLKSEIAVRNKFHDPYAFAQYLPDPDIVLRKNNKDITAYRELMIDSQVWACYQSRKYGVLSKEWSIDRGKAKSRNAKIIQNLFEEIDIRQLISDILEAPFYGFQPLEVMWEYTKGWTFPKRIIAKPPEWFRFNPENKLVLRPSYGKIEEIPPYKILCPVSNASYLNPYGEKVLSRCFWSVVFKKGGLKFWAYCTEKYGMPFIVGKIESQKSEQEIDAFADKLNAMIQDAIAVVSGDMSVDLLESTNKSGSAEIYEKLIAHCDASISKAILGQTLTTEIGSTGSYAASKTHQEVRQDIVDADTKLVEKTVNQLIDWIYELNWKEASDRPVFSLWEEEDVDKALAERDEILAKTGVKFTKKYFIKNYGFEEEDFDVTETAQEPEQESAQKEPAQFAEKLPKLDEMDNLMNSIENKTLQGQAEKILKPVMDLIQNAKDPEEAYNLLGETYPDMDVKDLQELLTKLIFISDVFGRIQANAE